VPAERRNLEHDATIIAITTKYRKKPTIEGQFVFRNAIAIMFDRLSVELKTTKPIVLILLTLMAQNGGAYYHNQYFSDRLHRKFRYKEFQLSIHQALDALTEGVTDGKERSYDAFKKRSDLKVPRNPILQNVFVALRDDIFYVAYAARLPGDLFPRVEHDERRLNQFVFSEEIRKDLCYFTWVSNFQMDNPKCPQEIRNWVQQNLLRFMLDHRLGFDKMIHQEEFARLVDKDDTICIAASTQEEPAISVYQINKIDGSRNFFRFDNLENLNLEKDSKLIAMAEQYVFNNQPTKEDSEYYLTKAIATMFARLVQETGASKPVVLILLAIMAQKGGSYYQTYMRNRLDDEFYYKEFHLSIRQVLNALTDGITCGQVSQYSELKQKKQGDPSILKTKPSLRLVFQELRNEIYYIADLGNLEGDLYPRYLNDNTNSFTELGKQNPRYYVWLSSFQLDNPSCPLEIREWLKTNRHKFMLDPKCHRIEGRPKQNKS